MIQKFRQSYLDNAAQILVLYDGSIPFSHFLKNYFTQHKKFGSRDRKQISKLCYAFFRLGKAYPGMTAKDRILLGLKYINEPVETEWQPIIYTIPLPHLPPKNIFPWKDALSDSIDAAAFETSFLTQPDLFLRIRPGFEDAVLEKLEAAKLEFIIEGSSVQLPNGVKAEDIFLINKEVVVQDLSSQKTSEFLTLVRNHFPALKIISVYDCCAASGGKSILAIDTLSPINLTVSDIRPSIISNLRKRFEQAGVVNYKSLLQDLSTDFKPSQLYDLVIADVPCTGSGTWARTPEQLYFFDKNKIAMYTSLQATIARNAALAVKPGRFLLYITCSVFKSENEEQAQNIMKNGFDLIQQETIKGYTNKADTMFCALLKKQHSKT